MTEVLLHLIQRYMWDQRWGWAVKWKYLTNRVLSRVYYHFRLVSYFCYSDGMNIDSLAVFVVWQERCYNIWFICRICRCMLPSFAEALWNTRYLASAVAVSWAVNDNYLCFDMIFRFILFLGTIWSFFTDVWVGLSSRWNPSLPMHTMLIRARQTDRQTDRLLQMRTVRFLSLFMVTYNTHILTSWQNGTTFASGNQSIHSIYCYFAMITITGRLPVSFVYRYRNRPAVVLYRIFYVYMSRLMIKPVKWYVRPAKTQIRLGEWASAQSDQSLRFPLEESLDP